MYENTKKKIRVDNEYSDVFPVSGGLHQDSVLSLLLLLSWKHSLIQN